jgi:L-gulonate 5-dehydrogenase
MTLGVEGAGEVAALGAGVSGIAVGDRVVVDPMRTCGECEDCRLGRDSACARLRFVGEHFDGTGETTFACVARPHRDANAPPLGRARGRWTAWWRR